MNWPFDISKILLAFATAATLQDGKKAIVQEMIRQLEQIHLEQNLLGNSGIVELEADIKTLQDTLAKL